MGEKENEQVLLIRELFILGDDCAELRVSMLLKLFLVLLHGQWLTCQLASVVRQLLYFSMVVTVL